MDIHLEPQKAITPQKAIRLLEKQGIEITPENAALVVSFLYVLAEVFCNQHTEE